MTMTRKSYHILLPILVKVESAVAIACLVAMTVISIMEIASRFFLGRSFIWAIPMIILLSNWMVFLGLGVMYYHRKYVVVEYFLKFFSSGSRRSVVLFSNFAVLLFFGFLLTQAHKLITMQSQKVEILPIPRFAYSLPLFIGSFLVIVTVVYQMWVGVEEGVSQTSMKEKNNLE